MRTATTLPGLPGQNVMERRHTGLLVALGVLTYLLVAATIGGAVVSTTALGPVVLLLPVGAGHLTHTTFDAPLGAWQVLSAAALVSLALGAYLLDTLPLVAIAALRRRTDPWHAWHELYGRTLFAELAVPIL